ncbi:MAG: MBL fold metallo-hydrolase [Planctomycetota bacterium]
MAQEGLKITILGSGTSHGVPMIACDCPVCTSRDPHDKRTRTSITIQYDGTTLLVDTSPELRLQCVANNVRRVDAVLYTHHHIDHIAGFDDLRRFNWVQEGPIPCHGLPETLARVRSAFAYAFEELPGHPWARPRISLREVHGPFEIAGRPITPIPLLHGDMPILGYRVGATAYCTDVSRIPDSSRPLLEGLDLLILEAVRKRPHPTHFNIEQAVEEAHRIGAKRTLFTHIAHQLGHEETNRALPGGMALAFDGQVVHAT